MNVPDIIIAVDGFSSTGKSTFAKMVAKEFGFLYLDSGAMYRGVTLFAMESGFIAEDGTIDQPALKAVIGTLDLHFRRDSGATLLFLGDRCIEDQIRTLEVSSHVSPVSAIPFVRNFVDSKLHAFSEGGRVIMDGRDIGTTVFPNAELKIFMTADENVRAQRRYDEMVSKGETPVFEEVLANLKERDYIDSHRETSPLSQAADAYVMDNTHMTMHEELVWALGVIQGKFGILEAALSC
ncbi:MAG: (d)CMP kinase [Bacteroidales bacterium]|nr:(d)CMP kinase [Bacteroidales bacterium]MCR4569963.1 (d)CMP kinase [Bacteroidales bacterium]